MNSEIKGPIAWMAQNHVAANLLMLIFLLGGIIMLSTSIKQEVFPDFEIDTVIIRVVYPGSSPAEVESGIILSIEEAINGLDGIKEIRSTASEGIGTVYAELHYDADTDKVSNDIENAVARITTFPVDAEDPVVEVPTTRNEVLQLVLYGDMDEHGLKELAEIAREDLLAYDEISQVDLSSTRPLEISIEVPQETLRTYGLTIGIVADTIRQSTVELPGGELKTTAGKVLLRTMERRDWAEQFADITIVSDMEGTNVRLGDIATISESFEDVEQFAFFNGKRALRLQVYRVGMQTPTNVSDAVHDYQDRITDKLPPGISTTIIADRSEIFHERLSLLVRNGLLGLILVFVFLGLFLQPTLAFWVGMGIPISFLGSLLFLPGADVSINMISLFAYIITLGIVVDDAIVVGENIYEHRLRGDDCTIASVRGAREIAMPVVFSVLTTVAAFAPMLFVQGVWGKVMRNIPIVVIIVFIISLFESLFILPAHLSQVRTNNCIPKKTGILSRFQRFMAESIVDFANKIYGPMVAWTVRNRWQTLAIGFAVLSVAVGYVKGGHIPITVMPSAEADWVNVQAVFPYDAPLSENDRVRRIIEDAAEKVIAENGGEKTSSGIISMVNGASQLNFTTLLTPPDQRDISTQDFADAWRKAAGEIVGLESLRFESAQLGPHSGKPLEIKLSHRDMDVLEAASNSLAKALHGYDGVIDIDDGFSEGKPQFDFTILSRGRSLGITAGDLGRQVRNAVYGAEALKQQRGRDTVSVMVRLPQSERVSEQTIDELMIRTPAGGEIPLNQAALATRGSSYISINRTDGRRTITVSADVIKGKADINKVIDSVVNNDLPAMMENYPGLSYDLAGERKQGMESFTSLLTGFSIALLVMYCLVAIPFRSYMQSIVVLFAIPFGFVGALIGHILFGYSLSLMSMFGVVALAGVVINDSLVLVHTANRMQSEGMAIADAMQNAGIRRFRPIILTSFTTFLGLTPMIFETSLQARFLIPMALSLGFGVLFATLITLLLVPAFYMIEVDVKELIKEIFADIRGFLRHKESETS